MAIHRLIANDMRIAAEAVSARCWALPLPADELKSRIWPWLPDPEGVDWLLLACLEEARLGPPFLRMCWPQR